MMFIQNYGDKSGETNRSTFENYIESKNGIGASFLLANTHLSMIGEDYLSIIDSLIEVEFFLL